MRLLYRAILTITVVLNFACSSKDTATKLPSAENFKFEITDSIMVDYLGKPKLSDISPDGNKVLLFNSRNSEFIITNSKGEIENQFEKSGDIPDNPGTLADKPVFLNDSTVICYGQKGVYAYNIKGENVWKLKKASGNFWLSRIYTRNIFTFDSGEYITIINYDFLDNTGSEDSMYQHQHGLKLIKIENKELQPVLYLNESSRFLDGKGYEPAKMLPNCHSDGERLVATYDKDTLIYMYDWENNGFQLKQKFSLDITPFYLDEGVERASLKDRQGFSFGDKVGEAYVSNAWLLNDSTTIVQYNEGLPINERKETELKRIDENTVTLVEPDNLPEDKFQLYVNGNKTGKPIEAPLALGNLCYVRGNEMWFSKDYEALDLEENYAVFYQVKMVPD